MAVRLSVIMVHSTPRSATAQQLAQGVVGELIGLAGIDLTLVEPLGQLKEASTDRLTLDSLSGDVAVLDWHRPAEIAALLAGLGFSGARAPHANDLSVPPPPPRTRKIYAFDLSDFSTTEDVIQALTRLNEDRQVRAFTLGPLPISSSRPGDGHESARPSDPPSDSVVDAPLGDSAAIASKSAPTDPADDPAAASNSPGVASNPSGVASNPSGVASDSPGVLRDSQSPEGEQQPPVGHHRQPLGDAPIDLDELLDQLDRSDP